MRRSLTRRRKGSFVVLFALLNTVLFWFAALAVDVSYIRTVHGQMQRAVDAAAHGVLVTYCHGGDQSQSVSIGLAASAQNLVLGQPLGLVSSDFSGGYYDFTTNSFTASGPFNAVRVDHTAPLGLLFGPLVGKTSSTEVLRATAALRPREIVFVMDISTGNTAPTSAVPMLDFIDGMAAYSFAEDRLGMVLYQDSFFPNGQGWTPLSYLSSDYASIRSQWQSDLSVCGTGSMPACGGSNPADGLQAAVDILTGDGDNRFAQSIILVSNGEVSCDPYNAACVASRKNAALQVADVAAAVGISVYAVTMQGSASGYIFMESLRRGAALKGPSLDASNTSDLTVIMEFLANNIPVAIVE